MEIHRGARAGLARGRGPAASRSRSGRTATGRSLRAQSGDSLHARTSAGSARNATSQARASPPASSSPVRVLLLRNSRMASASPKGWRAQALPRAAMQRN
jgi:hypothetical protein